MIPFHLAMGRAFLNLSLFEEWLFFENLWKCSSDFLPAGGIRQKGVHSNPDQMFQKPQLAPFKGTVVLLGVLKCLSSSLCPHGCAQTSCKGKSFQSLSVAFDMDK